MDYPKEFALLVERSEHLQVTFPPPPNLFLEEIVIPVFFTGHALLISKAAKLGIWDCWVENDEHEKLIVGTQVEVAEYPFKGSYTLLISGCFEPI